MFRAFRERYLLIWTLGWLAYFVSRWTLADHAAGPVPDYLTAISQAEFVLAVCLFAAAIFVYTHARGLLLPLLLITLTVMGFAVARVWFWPESIHPARGAGSGLPDRRHHRCLSPHSLSLGALGNRSLAAEYQHAAAASALGPHHFAPARRI